MREPMHTLLPFPMRPRRAGCGPRRRRWLGPFALSQSSTAAASSSVSAAQPRDAGLGSRGEAPHRVFNLQISAQIMSAR